MDRAPVVIIGAGIGGLAAAVALRWIVIFKSPLGFVRLPVFALSPLLPYHPLP